MKPARTFNRFISLKRSECDLICRIEFYMNKNHRISIDWSVGLIETFRVVML